MATSKSYLVPVDFSKGSEIALKHALALAKRKGGRLLLYAECPVLIVKKQRPEPAIGEDKYKSSMARLG